MIETNIKKNKDVVTDKDIAALEKAVSLEEKRRKQGWRYIQINSRMQLFVPCDKNGKPTEVGQRMIKNCGINS